MGMYSLTLSSLAAEYIVVLPYFDSTNHKDFVVIFDRSHPRFSLSHPILLLAPHPHLPSPRSQCSANIDYGERAFTCLLFNVGGGEGKLKQKGKKRKRFIFIRSRQGGVVHLTLQLRIACASNLLSSSIFF